MEKEFTLKELTEMAKALIDKARTSYDKNKATILAMHGDLGTGKTTLSQEIAKQLGVLENIISPTFVIMKKYQTKDLLFKNLIHIDAYRLNKSQELLRLGWQDLVENKDNLIIIEWPENVPECLEGKVCHIYLNHLNEEVRSIKFD